MQASLNMIGKRKHLRRATLRASSLSHTSLYLVRIAACVMFVATITLFAASADAQTWCGLPVEVPEFPHPDQPPPCCECENNCKGSPNFLYSGNYSTSATDLSVPTRGLSLTLTRNYDSVRLVDGPFGISWTSSLTGSLYEAVYLYAAPSTYYKEVTIVMPNGRPYRFRENADGSYTPTPASHYTLVKNADGTFDLSPPQSRMKYHYSSNGQLASQTDEYGNSIVFTYDANGKLLRAADGAGSGRYLDFTYGASGRVSTVLDSANRAVSYTYDASGALTAVTNAASRQTYYSYVTGRFNLPLLSQIRDHWNRSITSISYTTAGKTNCYSEAGETYCYYYNYQNDPQKVKKQDSSNYEWVFTYDANGLVTSRIPPSGQGGGTVTSGFNADGSVQYSIDETGVKTSYTYNANGSVATITRDDAGALAVRFDYAYDPAFPEKVISITPRNPGTNTVDPNWQAWKYDYYQAGSTAPGALHHVYRVQTNGTTLDTIAVYAYNSSGQVLTVSDQSGAVTTYAYDAATGDLSSVSYPKNSDAGPNPVYAYGRDAIGRVTSVTDPQSKTTSYTYDAIDRIATVTLPKPVAGSPLNFVTTYSYDNYDAASGLVFTHQTDPNAKVTKQGYDEFGQLRQSKDALNKTTTFAYTKGLLTTITDANGNYTTYSYNGLKRLTSTAFHSANGFESNTYYADGTLKTWTDRLNRTTTYAYDRLKRLVSKTYPNAVAVTYTYNGQKLESVNDAFSGETHSFTYDASYRISSNTQGTRGTVTYAYNVDRIQSYSVSGGPQATYDYYEDGSVKNIQWTPLVGYFSYQYTPNGQYSTISFPNGQSRNYTYDDQGRLTQIQNGTAATFAYGYDNPLLGQRTSMTSAPGTTNYTYDSNYQLAGATYPNAAPFNGEAHSWTYDNIGNRLTNTVNSTTQNYTYFKDSGNTLNSMRIQSNGTNSYGYQNATIISDGTYTYTRDYDRRITGITGGGLTASYTYDYLGRRKSKTINGVATTYLYDGQNLIREMSTTNADYVFGPGIDEPLAVSRSGAVSYYNVDGLGSVASLSDSSGAVQNTYQYDAWGILRSQTGSTQNPFTYTARESGEAGLMFYRARYYNPTIGRFTSEDRIPTEKRNVRELNGYGYVANNPIRFIDPNGLKCKDVQPCLECFIKQAPPPMRDYAEEALAKKSWSCDPKSDYCFDEKQGKIYKCLGYVLEDTHREFVITDIDPLDPTDTKSTPCRVIAHEMCHAFSHIDDDDLCDMWSEYFVPKCCSGAL